MSDINQSLFVLLHTAAGVSASSDRLIVFFARDFAYLLVIVFLIWLWIAKMPKKEKVLFFLSTCIAESISLGIFTQSARLFYHHLRPYLAIPSVTALLTETTYSFPSGHTVFFFTLSALLYQHNRMLGRLFFLSSVIIGLTRVIAGVHYPLDILGGAVLGLLVGFCVPLCITFLEQYFKK